MERKYTILIVDDEIELLKSLQLPLSAKYRVLTAQSGVQALEIIAENTIDCMLMDVRMPGLTGLEVLQKLQASKPKLPVIIFTGHGDADTVNQAIEYGAVGYIKKPPSLYVIADKIDEAIATASQKALTEQPLTILFVDKNTAWLKQQTTNFSQLDYIVKTETTYQLSANLLSNEHIDILFANSDLADGDGMALITTGIANNPDMVAVLMTDIGTSPPPMQGDYYFLKQPVLDAEIAMVVAQGQQKIRIKQALELNNRELSNEKELLVKAKEALEAKTDELQAQIIERKRAETIVVKSLEEKEVLLREIHHRVKNNLMIVSSLITLQLNRVNDERYASLLQSTQSRIDAIAFVHESLYSSDDVANVGFRKYIQRLLGNLSSMYLDTAGVELVLEIAEININIERATPCGLIIHELVVNAIKHAFPGIDNKVITIAFAQHEDTGYKLVVRDNGVGLPADFQLKKTKSLGMTLVRTLTQQLRGKLTLDQANGTVYTIIF